MTRTLPRMARFRLLLAATVFAACSDGAERKDASSGSVRSNAGMAGMDVQPEAGAAADAGAQELAPAPDASVRAADLDAGPRDPRAPDAARSNDAGAIEAGPADAMAGDDAGAEDASIKPELCDGSDALRLVAVRGIGGMPEPGSGVMYENGSSFLLVRGDCRYWVYSGRYQRTRTGQLTGAQRERLTAGLRLDQWADYTGDYTRGAAFEVPDQYVAFGVGAIDAPCSVSQTCVRLSTGPADTSQKVAWLEPSLRQEIGNLEQEGIPLSGALRYVLAEQTWNGAEIWATAATWPLGDPATFALSEANARAYTPGQNRLATGADAEALRSIWLRYLAGEIGDRTLAEIIPVAAGSTRYHFFVRDSLPFEDARGLLPTFVPL